MPTIGENFSAIADAIRELRETNTTYTPEQMANAIGQYINPLYGIITLSVDPENVWTRGTDNDVLLMVQAANEGIIDLTDYWTVGDTRSVSISAMSATGVSESHVTQTVEMVLMHANPDKYTYVTQVASGRTKPFFIYGQKNCLIEEGYMNSTNTNSGSWNSTKRKTWCDNVYREAVPAYLKTITKQVNFITGVYNGNASGGSNQSCTGYFFLPAEKEIFGSRTYSTSNEANALEQWTWYVNSNNRKKYLGPTPASPSALSCAYWSERSPKYGASSHFCYVTVGTPSDNAVIPASTTCGIAPCGCI